MSTVRYSVLVQKFDGSEREFACYASAQEAEQVAQHFLSLGAAARVEPVAREAVA